MHAPRYRNCRFCFILLFCALFSLPVNALQLGDIVFPDSVTLDGTDTAIQLNGMGYRTKFIFKVYVAGLYLQSRVHTRDDAQALSGPKRVVMHFVYDEVEREKIIKGWNEGFRENTSDEQLAKLASRLETLNSYFPDLKAGDVVLLDYIPETGTRVTINGAEKGIIPGADFYAVLLDVWLGDEPADDDLKEALLGQENNNF